jgi:tetratricopeptide (TPR) repeat protein
MSPKKPNRPDRRRDQSGRGRPDRDRSKGGDGRRGSIAAVPTGDLPRWVRDEITRTAPKARREPAITHLAKAVDEFADERYGAAYAQLRSAKDLAPQAATIRELLGLSAYHLGKWQEALRELRTFRRISGEPTQVPVELDCLRALGRTEDVEKTFRQLKDLDPRPETDDEARVVFASSLLDRGLVAEAWKVIKPGRLVANPRPSALRRWYVASRVAAASGDTAAARQIVDAITNADSDFPGLAELRQEIAGAD